MASVTSTTTINQPVEKVFDYMVDVKNHTAWQSMILEAKITPEGPAALGSVYHYTSEVMGNKMQSAMEISAFEPNKKWAVRTTGVPTPVETVYEFADAGGATTLTISMELSGGFPAAAEGAIKAQMQKNLDDQGALIKKMVGG